MPGMRGMSSKKMSTMMKRLGIQVEELSGVKEVIIRMEDKKLVIPEPDVTLMNMQGQNTYQVVGDAEEFALGDGSEKEGKKRIDIPKEDIDMVVSQANVSEKEAREALEKSDGDIAEAIILLMNR